MGSRCSIQHCSLVQWNHPFLSGIGIEPLQNMPLDESVAGAGGVRVVRRVPDLEVEIARRVGVLRSGDECRAAAAGPDGETLILRGLPIEEGGFMLLLNGLASWQRPPGLAPSTEMDEPPIYEMLTPVPGVWLRGFFRRVGGGAIGPTAEAAPG